MTSWRLALRMARREIGRDRGRSAFIWLMILLPVIGICTLQIAMATGDTSEAERLDLEFGSAQAELEYVGEAFVPDYVNGGSTTPNSDGSHQAKPIPGWGESVAAQQDAVAALLGRKVVAVTETLLEGARADSSVAAMGVDFGATSASNFVHNVHGSYPRDHTEALVTPSGVKAGLPTSGTVTLRRDGDDDGGHSLTFTVVGTAEGQFENVVDLVSAPDPSRQRTRFFVFGGDPIGWDEAVRLASNGFTVTSRDLLAHPPAEYTPGNSEAVRNGVIWTISAAALLEIALAVGPAFAIGAARQRRTLALAASNGATTGHLRRAAIGQALLLGSSAAALGTAIGIGTGAALGAWMISDRTQLQGPLEFPVGQLALAFLAGTATAVGSALVTSRGLGRLDLVSALRGSIRPAPPRRGAPLVGVLLAAAGVAGAWVSMRLDYRVQYWVWAASGFAVLVGCLLLVPGTLRLLSRGARRLPVPVRMALRDSARQHGRATSTVAAVLAGGLILTALWTLILSQDADSARRYTPSLPMGQAQLDVSTLSGASVDAAKAAGQAVAPALRIFSLATVTGHGKDEQDIHAVPAGCTARDLDAETEQPRCLSLSTGGETYGSSILFGSPDDLVAAFDLTPEQRQVLASGGVLANTDPGPVASSDDAGWAQTRLAGGRLTFVQNLGDASESTVTLPAAAISKAVIARGAAIDRVGGLIASSTATKLDWVSGDRWLQFADPAGPISPQVESALATALDPWAQNGQLRVERGHQSTQQLVMWVVTAGVVLMLVVAAVISTVMSTAELRPFLGTFAAVGADPSLNRRLAAVQGWLLTVMGTAMGAVIGAAIAAPMAVNSTEYVSETAPWPPIVVFPWLPMATLVVVVPAIAAGVAACCAPRRVSLGRRLT